MGQISQSRPKGYRFLEMIPGLISWNIILFLVWGSFLVPQLVAYFVIAFLIFWLYQSFQASTLGIIGYFKIKRAKTVNWKKRYQKEYQKGWLEWEKIKHIVIVPIVNEPISILERNLSCLSKQKGISPSKLIVVLALEGRVKGSQKVAQQLEKKYQGKFGKLIATVHPPKLPGEIIGKAANEAWAAKKIKEKLIDELGWNINYLTITSCDTDACFNPKYFAALTYNFAKNPKRHLRFWQSPIFYYNNLNEVPFPIRIVSILSNVIHIAHLQEPDKLIFNQSAYSLSLKLLDEVGYWDTDIIPEDWHIFLQTFFAKKGQTMVVPIFTPTNMDAPEGENYWDALKNRYLQCQRHAWGATDIPYAINKAFRVKDVPLLAKVLRVYKLVKSHAIWSTNWFILTLGASLPPLLNPRFFQTSLGYNLPKFSQLVLNICLLSMVVIIALDILLRPKDKRQKLSFWGKVAYLAQWVTMPVVTLFMAVLPGLDAQTKLLFGKRLEYWVTKKY